MRAIKWWCSKIPKRRQEHPKKSRKEVCWLRRVLVNKKPTSWWIMKKRWWMKEQAWTSIITQKRVNLRSQGKIPGIPVIRIAYRKRESQLFNPLISQLRKNSISPLLPINNLCQVSKIGKDIVSLNPSLNHKSKRARLSPRSKSVTLLRNTTYHKSHKIWMES